MSGKRTGITCRCPICHRNDAGSNRHRKSYVACGLKQDERGIYSTEFKVDQRRTRRRIEKRQWKSEIWD